MSEHHCPECGAIFETESKKAKDRSTPQHRRLFAAVRAAFFAWPDTSEFRPKNEEHLRHWLTVRAERFDVKQTARIESTDPDKLYALFCAFMKHSEDNNLFLELDGNLLIEKKAHSIAFEAMSQHDFNKLNEAIAEIIEIEVGVSVEKLLREKDKAA